MKIKMKKILLGIALVLIASTASAVEISCQNAKRVRVEDIVREAGLDLTKLNTAIEKQRKIYALMAGSDRDLIKASQSNDNVVRYKLILKCGTMGSVAVKDTLIAFTFLHDYGILP